MKREYDFSHAKRAPVVQVPKGKTRITIRLDDDLLDWFRQQVSGPAAATIKARSTMLFGSTFAAPRSRWKRRCAASSARNSATPAETSRFRQD